MPDAKDEKQRIKEFLHKHRPLGAVPLGRKWEKPRAEALRIIDEYRNISSIEFWRLMNNRGIAVSKDYARKLKQRASKDWAILSRPGKRISIPIVKKPKLKSFNVKEQWNKDLFSPFNGILITDFIFLDSVREAVIEGSLKPVRGLCVRDGRHVACYLPFEVHDSGFLMGDRIGRHIGFRVPFRFAGVSRTCFAFLEESDESGSPRFVIFDRSKRHFGTEQIEFDSVKTAAFFFSLLFDGYGSADLFARLRVREVVGFHGRDHKTESLFKKSEKSER